MLCDHVETAEGKLFINGAAISTLWVAPAPPHVVNLGIAAVAHVPYTETDRQHVVRVTVVDEDGEPVAPWSPDELPDAPPIEIVGEFSVGRPPALAPGESQAVPLAFQVNSLPMPRVGLCSVVVEVDGDEVRRLPFRVAVVEGG